MTSSSSLNRKVTLFAILCLLLILVVTIFHYLSTNLDKFGRFSKLRIVQGLRTESTMTDVVTIDTFWDKSFELTKKLPDEIISKADNVIVSDKTVSVDNVNVFYRESIPDASGSELTLLLLHGMRFSSKTWLELKTIQVISAAGYRVVAVDLPGFANTPKPSSEIEDKGGFLSNLIKSLGISQPVIVSPSFSGFYSLPLLVKDWKTMKGFIPVAPVGQDVLLHPIPSPCPSGSKSGVTSSDKFKSLPDYFKSQIKEPIPNLSCIDTPTMVVHGEHDRSLSSALLSLIPTAKAFEIPDGDHPAYLKNPLLWHTIVYNFLQRLDRIK